jgi:hypothetical protein
MHASQTRRRLHIAVTRIGSRLTNFLRRSEAWQRFFGIILCAIRLRKFAKTTAVKWPEAMRDVARIRCDQAGVIKVDDPMGTWAFRIPDLRLLRIRKGQEPPAL